MDDLFDGCLDGCGDGCFDFDGCFSWWPWGGNRNTSTPEPSNRPGYTPGYVTGSALGEAADAVTEGDDERRTGKPRHGEPGHICKPKPQRIRLKFRVRVGHERFVDELVEFGKSELQMAKITCWLSLRLRLRYRTHVVVAFGSDDQHEMLKAHLKGIASANPELVKI